MKVAIYDSNSECRRRLCDIVTAALTMADFEVQISEYNCPADLLTDTAGENRFDFVIFSVNSLSCENNSALNTIKEKLTCFTLVKPYSVKAVILKIEAVIKSFSVSKYLIVCNRKIQVINTDDILYIESNNSKCIFHCKDGRLFVQYKQLGKIEKDISASNFIRCHKSFLVNMDYIASADKTFVLSNGEEILIRQRDLSAIKQKALEYHNNSFAKI